MNTPAVTEFECTEKFEKKYKLKPNRLAIDGYSNFFGGTSEGRAICIFVKVAKIGLVLAEVAKIGFVFQNVHSTHSNQLPPLDFIRTLAPRHSGILEHLPPGIVEY